MRMFYRLFFHLNNWNVVCRFFFSIFSMIIVLELHLLKQLLYKYPVDAFLNLTYVRATFVHFDWISQIILGNPINDDNRSKWISNFAVKLLFIGQVRFTLHNFVSFVAQKSWITKQSIAEGSKSIYKTINTHAHCV